MQYFMTCKAQKGYVNISPLSQVLTSQESRPPHSYGEILLTPM
jgi:hypothetical protein